MALYTSFVSKTTLKSRDFLFLKKVNFCVQKTAEKSVSARGSKHIRSG